MFLPNEAATSRDLKSPLPFADHDIEAPRNRDSDHDKSSDKSRDGVITVPRNRGDTLAVEVALEQIEDRIEAIENELAACGPLVIERSRLLRARALLLDEVVEDGSTPDRRPQRVARDDVARAVAAAPGSRAGELARSLGTSQPAVSAHLYRGKRELFENRGGRWFLRERDDFD